MNCRIQEAETSLTGADDGTALNWKEAETSLTKVEVSTLDVTSNLHLPSQCLDHLNGIFAVVKTMHGSNIDDDLPDGGTHYPSNGTMLKNMVTYLYEQKIPDILPRELCCQVHDNAFPKLLVSDEMFCTFSHDKSPLSDPILITSKARIVTMNGIVEEVSTFCKKCIKCGAMYRYQEFKDQLHNFNDHVLISLNLCLFLRSSLQTHSAVSRVIDSLENLNHVKYPSSDTCLHAYLHFEALCDNTYNFSCASCGDHPPVVIMDLHIVFSMAVSDIEETPKDFKGRVNIEAFWNAVSLEMIGWGFVSKFGKIKTPKVSEESQVYHVTEDRLMEEFMNQKVDVVRKLCKECGLDTVGSKLDLISRLHSEMQTQHSYDKIFRKIWGASGMVESLLTGQTWQRLWLWGNFSQFSAFQGNRNLNKSCNVVVETETRESRVRVKTESIESRVRDQRQLSPSRDRDQ
ncbi:hypothetical protein F2P79_018177 [Pimephales promelas]|nr:hypothetical protein F2P79_018177 [Pimephales promelas]